MIKSFIQPAPEHKLCQTPKKDVNIARFKHARAKLSINKLSIIPLVTWLFLADKLGVFDT